MVLENRPAAIMEYDDLNLSNQEEPPQPSPAAVEEEQVNSRICPECGKGFRSGKALGGHLSSAHVQANKELSMKKLRSKMGKQQRSGSGWENEIVCAICRNPFPSIKSLYGHMRVHPERNWRGMDPPQQQKMKKSPTENSSEPESYDSGPSQEEGEFYYNSDSGHELSLNSGLLLQGWSVTAKRGRKGLKSAAVSPSVSPNLKDQEVYGAVHQLIRLVNDVVGSGKETLDRDEGISSNSLTPQRPEPENRDSGLTKRKIREMSSSAKRLKIRENDDDVDESENKKNSMDTEVDFDQVKNAAVPEDYDKEADSKGANPCRIQTGPIFLEQKSKPVNSFPPEDGSSPDKFVCPTCGKRFSTHQAYGGHKSSHKKLKISIYNTNDEQKKANPNKSRLKGEKRDIKKTNVIKKPGEMMRGLDQELVMRDGDGVYSCKICNKGFVSVEALVFHKRSHRNGLVEPVSSSRDDSYTDENNESERKGLGLDLNEMPNGDEENS